MNDAVGANQSTNASPSSSALRGLMPHFIRCQANILSSVFMITVPLAVYDVCCRDSPMTHRIILRGFVATSLTS